MSTIRDLLAEIDMRHKYEMNVASSTAAQGVHYLIQYMHRQIYGGGKDAPAAPDTEPRKFLPFPNFNPDGEAEDDTTTTTLLKSSTKKLIERLAREGRIPLKVRDALVKVPPSLTGA